MLCLATEHQYKCTLLIPNWKRFLLQQPSVNSYVNNLHPIENVSPYPASRWGQSESQTESKKSWKFLDNPIVCERLPIGLSVNEVSSVPGCSERSLTFTEERLDCPVGFKSVRGIKPCLLSQCRVGFIRYAAWSLFSLLTGLCSSVGLWWCSVVCLLLHHSPETQCLSPSRQKTRSSKH